VKLERSSCSPDGGGSRISSALGIFGTSNRAGRGYLNMAKWGWWDPRRAVDSESSQLTSLQRHC
jgi:hypothetical protein